VGADVLEKFEKVAHVVPQWSFNDAFDEDDIRAFDERVRRGLGSPPEYIAELKIDGLKIVLTYEKGALKFEDELSGSNTLDGLDIDLLNRFKKELEGSDIDTWQFLKDNGLAVKHKDRHELTKAGVLIFARNPSIALKGKFGIKISHYHGTKPEFTGEPNFLRRPFTIEGPLLYQIEHTVKYFRDAVRSFPPKLKHSIFQSSLLIPEWAFQEAVTNAVIHRNYSMQNDIQIRFFDNRIEIESPGTFPGQVTINNILTERYSRNPIILRTLNRFAGAPNLDIGEGVGLGIQGTPAFLVNGRPISGAQSFEAFQQLIEDELARSA